MNRLLNNCALVISLLMLLFSIGFNLWLYKAEPTALVDPNDNAFQYALVERTNEIWDWADKTCPKNLSHAHCLLSYLIDHWVPNWAEGYNLPYYYSHVPQIVIVSTYRLFSAISHQLSLTLHSGQATISLFQYYHWIIYLLLCLFPLSVFLSLRLLKLPWLTAGIGALLATQISTDGLYGLDPSSFLWRGWGLSSQLFAMIWMPLAITSIIRLMINDQRSKISAFSSFILHPSSFILSVLFITLTTMGHLGMGLMLFLTIPVITFTKPILTLFIKSRLSLEEIWEAVIKTFLLALPPLILLSYWIIPTILTSQYHNISFWDPVWKFNSYGTKEVMVNLLNGNLFDFGRLPIYTALVFIGFFVCLLLRSIEVSKYRSIKDENFDTPTPRHPDTLTPLPFLFLFFLLLYFGRTTWGNVLNLIPGMDEFHQHRFIVGLHLMSLFLAPIGFMWIIDQLIKIIRFMIYDLEFKNEFRHKSYFLNLISPLTICLTVLLSICLFLLLSPQTIAYGQYNETLIKQANRRYSEQKSDADLLIQTLKILPSGRVYAGRGGGWGKSFRVAETPYYMYLSTFGIPTVLWLPQTWSLNSDTEQYFSEDNQSHYDLYNIRYVVAPPTQPPQKFWTLLKETKNWKLYEIDTNYITVGAGTAVVFSDKLSFGNLIRLWIQSEYPKKQLFPELRLRTKNEELGTILPHFSMVDEATYQTPDGKTHSLFAEPPLYINPISPPTSPAGGSTNLPIQILSQSSDHDMVFRATIKVLSPTSALRSLPTVICPTCIVILKETYHPNWTVTVNSKKMDTIQVFPSFVAVRLEEPGEYEIVFSYQPSKLKQLLFFGTIITLLVLAGIVLYRRCSRLSPLRRKKRN